MLNDQVWHTVSKGAGSGLGQGSAAQISQCAAALRVLFTGAQRQKQSETKAPFKPGSNMSSASRWVIWIITSDPFT